MMDAQVKWFGISLVLNINNKQNTTWPVGDTKFLFSC